MVFYTVLGIRRDIIYKFWINRTKDIDFSIYRGLDPNSKIDSKLTHKI
jgi:hypothetical protein